MDPKGWRTRLGINIYESTSCLSVLGFVFFLFFFFPSGLYDHFDNLKMGLSSNKVFKDYLVMSNWQMLYN